MSKKSSSDSPQLPLDLSVPVAHTREDLIQSSANEMAIAMVDAWPEWPGRVSVLAGPVGAGKTHIASVWADKAKAVSCQSINLSNRLDEFVKLASQGGNFLVEDVGSGLIDETAMFHFLNAVKQGTGYCLMTSRSWPVEWNVELADLASRLKAVQVFELSEPDDVLLRHVMMKLFADRQLTVDDKIIEYCVLRMERSLESAGRLVEAIDEEAMSRKSSISRTTASQALERLGMN